MNINEEIGVNMYYFAYGMNTNNAQMSARCDAKNLGIACLKGYKLVMRTHADIAINDNDQVFGVLWEITHDDLIALDMLEGYPYYYDRIRVNVYHNNTIVTAYVYIMNDNHYSYSPSITYVKCIENGYRENDISLSQLHDALIELYDNEEYYENGW